MNKRIINTFLILSVILFSAENLIACSCLAKPPIYEYFKNFDAVFSGKVIGSKDIETKESEEDEDGNETEYVVKERVFEFEVSEVFKGIKGKKVNLNVGLINSSCYEGLDVGESYLIYADKDEDGKNLRGGLACSRSGELLYAQDQIHFIRELLKGKPESQIYGSVVRSDNYPNTTKTRSAGLDSIKIILEGEGKRFETVSDNGGFFKFNKIPDGEYSLKPEPPLVYGTSSSGVRLKILKGEIYEDYAGNGFESGYKSLFADFSITWDNEVQGRVLDAEGKPVRFAAVRLLPVVSPFEKIKNSYLWDEDEDGSYSRSGKTPGKYYLAAEIFMPSGANDRVRIFYPQAETPDKANLINLTATDKFNLDLILPPKFTLREITGKINWADGTPARGVEVSLQKSETFVEKAEEDSDEITDHGFDRVFTDAQGNFKLQAFENEEYWIHYKDELEIESDGEEKEIVVKGKPIKIKIGKVNDPVTLNLTKP